MNRSKVHIIDKTVEIIKFSLVVLMICFLIIKAPQQASQVINIATGLVIGGSVIKSKLGL